MSGQVDTLTAEKDAEIAALKEALEAADARWRREEQSHLHTIDQRDHAEEIINSLVQAVLIDPPEWSNLYGFGNAVIDVQDAISARDARAATAETQLAGAREAAIRECAEVCRSTAQHYRELVAFGHHAPTFSAISSALAGQADAILALLPQEASR